MSLPKPPNRGASPNAAPLGPAADYRMILKTQAAKGKIFAVWPLTLEPHR